MDAVERGLDSDLRLPGRAVGAPAARSIGRRRPEHGPAASDPVAIRCTIASTDADVQAHLSSSG